MTSNACPPPFQLIFPVFCAIGRVVLPHLLSFSISRWGLSQAERLLFYIDKSKAAFIRAGHCLNYTDRVHEIPPGKTVSSHTLRVVLGGRNEEMVIRADHVLRHVVILAEKHGLSTIDTIPFSRHSPYCPNKISLCFNDSFL